MSRALKRHVENSDLYLGEDDRTLERCNRRPLVMAPMRRVRDGAIGQILVARLLGVSGGGR